MIIYSTNRGAFQGLDVAIKQFKTVDNFTTAMVQDFEQEVKHLSVLQHPNVVEFVGAVIGPNSSKLWLLTKYPLIPIIFDHSNTVIAGIRNVQTLVIGIECNSMRI